MFHVYVLRSEKDGKLYVGHTDDLERRMHQHHTGMVISTKHRRPLDLIHSEIVKSKVEALKKECYFKSGFGRKYIKSNVS